MEAVRMQKSILEQKQVSGQLRQKFQEFVIDFNQTGKTVEEINKELLKENIFGGKDLSHDFPELGQCALYCVSEITTLEEMEHLRDALKRIVKGE